MFKAVQNDFQGGGRSKDVTVKTVVIWDGRSR